MKIVYFHGLESSANPHNPKIQFLESCAQVWAPQIDWTTPHIATQLMERARLFAPDLVIGSSAGGAVALHTGRAMGTPTLLFNPAVAQPRYLIEIPKYTPQPQHNTLVLGQHDNIQPAQPILDWFQKNNIDYVVEEYPAGHRVPFSTFSTAISNWIRSHKS